MSSEGCYYQVSHTKSLRNACGVRRAGTYCCSAIAPEATSAGAHTHAHLAVMTGRGAAKGQKAGDGNLRVWAPELTQLPGPVVVTASSTVSKGPYRSTFSTPLYEVQTRSLTAVGVLLPSMHKALTQRDNSDRPRSQTRRRRLRAAGSRAR